MEADVEEYFLKHKITVQMYGDVVLGDVEEYFLKHKITIIVCTMITQKKRSGFYWASCYRRLT